MITFETPQGRFNYRVTGVAIVEGHVLLHRAAFRWHSLDRLHTVRIEPAFLRESLRNLPQSTTHTIQRG